MENIFTEDEVKLLNILLLNFLLSGDVNEEDKALMLSITQKLEG